jgi:hypothetical protein
MGHTGIGSGIPIPEPTENRGALRCVIQVTLMASHEQDLTQQGTHFPTLPSLLSEILYAIYSTIPLLLFSIPDESSNPLVLQESIRLHI